MPPREIPLKDRLLAKVEKAGGCWLWRGSAGPKGYGAISVQAKTLRAHRASYEVFKGPIPPGMSVCHTCDVRLCINPDHLFVGTNQENVADRDKKGRVQRGARHYNAKLTEEQVREMRRLAASGVHHRDIATQFNITPQAAGTIIRGGSWKHVPLAPEPGRNAGQ